MTKMNPDIKARWVAALRAGDYKQGRGYLRVNDKFCCLGVLCDVYAKDQGSEWRRPADCEVYRAPTGRNTIMLPDAVAAWAGLDSQDPLVPVRRRDATREELTALSVLNDSRRSFKTIANLIEAHL